MSRAEPIPAGWREPTSRLPLHWGTYRERYAFGLTLIVGGGIHIQGSNTYTLIFLLIGTTSTIVGWSILPATGWRRLLAVVPAAGQTWLLLTGPLAVWTLVIPYLCWLMVRHRPPVTYLTALLPLANGIVIPLFFTEYSGMPAALAISIAVLIASAWIARAIAKAAGSPAALPSPSALK